MRNRRKLTLTKLYRAESALQDVLDCKDFPADEIHEGGSSRRLIEQVLRDVLMPLEHGFPEAER